MSTADALWCVVPAAGSGARFGAGAPKQYAELGGKPMLAQTLERLAAMPCIAGLVVVLAADDRRWAPRDALLGKPVRTTAGGEQRAHSVLAGLHALRGTLDDDAFVLVHDAARPCIARADVERLIARGSAAGGALLAAPLHDTLKRGDDADRVVATEPREQRWRALTPQLFRLGELTAALEAAITERVAVTDEAMAMERAGHRPLLVEGAASNIKVTTPDDLAYAEFVLRREARDVRRET